MMMMRVLSTEQRAFVTAPRDVHQTLRSWAGTGKTHTLTERVLHLITQHGVRPSSIVVTTFTVEGAHECRGRIEGRLDEEGVSGTVHVGTMDSIARQWMHEFFPPAHDLVGVQEYGLMLLDYLRTESSCRLKAGVSYLVVDEFQDLNRIQLDTVLEIARCGARVLAIGDVAQNIYSWRGCHARYLADLGTFLDGVVPFELTQNRRCTPEIIRLGNACLSTMAVPGAMRAVRPVSGHKPALQTVSHGSFTSAVISAVRQRIVAGADAGDVAVVSRYKQGIFNVEEGLVRSTIPFVTSASVGDAEDPSPRRRPGYLTLTTIHQSKGLEWPSVVLLLWRLGECPEEWRLLYVAITRARDRLLILSPNSGTTAIVLQRLGLESFDIAGDDPGLAATIPPPLPHARRAPVTGVVDVIRNLSGEHIAALRDRDLLPGNVPHRVGPSPGCASVLRVPLDAEADEVAENGLHIEFGNFVDRHVSRALCAAAGVEIQDRDAHMLLHTVFVTAEQGRLLAEFEVDALAQDLADALGAVAARGGSREQLAGVCDVFKKIDLHRRYTQCASPAIVTGRAPLRVSELATLRASYNTYVNPAATPKLALRATFRVAMCAVVLKGRRGMWYHPSAFKWFARRMRRLASCIERFVHTACYGPGASDKGDAVTSGECECSEPCSVANEIDKNKKARVERKGRIDKVKLTLADSGLIGEADATTYTGIIEIKCSSRALDFQWLLQGLAYVAMSGLHELCVFNPVTRSVWEVDCRGWSKDRREGFLDFLHAVSEEKTTELTDSVDRPSADRPSADLPSADLPSADRPSADQRVHNLNAV